MTDLKSRLGVALIAFLFATPALAETVKPLTNDTLLRKPSISNLQISYSIGCIVQGTPVEFPNDIVLSNEGAFTIPAGLKVDWVVRPGAYKGSYTFAAQLKPGKNVILANVMSGSAGAGTPCTVTQTK